MKVAVLKETFPGECRVGLVPANISRLTKAGVQLVIESGAGAAAGFSDEDYRDQGAEVVPDRARMSEADVVVQVRSLGANPEKGHEDLGIFQPGQVVLGTSDPLGNPGAIADRKRHV